jgi:hypothetical protein
VTGRRLRAHETAMRRTLGIFALLYLLSYNIWWNRNGFDPAIGLPLHICDLNGVIAPPVRAFILVALVAVAFPIVALPWQLADRPWRQRSAT